LDFRFRIFDWSENPKSKIANPKFDPMQRILIISDNLKSTAALQQELICAGYPVLTCGGDRAGVLQAVSPRPPDVLVLDTLASRLAVKELRGLLHQEFASHSPLVIALMAREELPALDLGAGVDDFLLAPYSPEEMVARLKLLLWKNNRVDAEQLIKVGELVVDQAKYAVYIAGQPLELTFKEYELLRFLATHRGRVFTREALLNQVWGYDYYGGTRTVDVHVRRIRAKLGSAYEDLLETVRNVGYRFNDPS
jgi:DNA-binding response OmpR family regulator